MSRIDYDAIYAERLAWKFDIIPTLKAFDPPCRVCGARLSDHGKYNLICPTANRLPDIPPVPATLDALVFRPLLRPTRAKRRYRREEFGVAA